MRHIVTILLALLLTGAGLFVGRYLATQPTETAGPDPHAGCGHAAEAAPPPSGGLAPQTLATLGVTVAPAARRDFLLTQKVQAEVVDRPRNARPIVAPFGGIVTQIDVGTGTTVEAGQVMLVIARDPIPRPKPELTADILTPLSESVHESVSTLRLAVSQLGVTEKELTRVRPFVDNQTLPRKTLIDLEYQLAKDKQQLANAREELRLHGLTDAEIEAVARGEHPPGNRSLWRRALAHNGLWPDEADEIYASLTCIACDLPWCVAAIGELVATGLLTPEFREAVATQDELCAHFAEVVGLLLGGMPLETVRLLAREGALEAQIQVRAPLKGPAQWDVAAVHVRTGQRVEAGRELVTLHDARKMWLRLEPIGAEVGLVSGALEQGAPLRASPLIPGAGPTLDGVRLERMATQGEEGGRGGRAYAVVTNQVLGGPAGTSRSWALRVGLRYIVEVPIRVFENRFVLPFDAVTKQGPDRIAFLEDGDTFRPQVVHVEYEDDEIVVIADDGSLYEGDPVVTHGAFALGLAIDTGGGEKVDPHAGHSHN